MSDQFELDFDAKVKEADDIEIAEYNFSPTLLENGVIDYSEIQHDKIFLVNKKDILEKARPTWIPELDITGLLEDDFLPTTIKSSDGYYYVQTKKYVGMETNERTRVLEKKFETQIYKMSSDILAATVDYYIKKQRAENKKNGIKKTVSLPRRTKSMLTTRYNNMVELLRFIPEYKDNDELLRKYPNRSKSTAYKNQNTIIFNQYNELLSVLKGKTLDLNLAKQDFINAYAKGEITSYGDTGISNALYQDYGVKIKKQNGSTFSLEERSKLTDALDSVYNYYGNLSNLAKQYGLKISYADNCKQHARKAIGLFTNYHKAIGVSFFNDLNDESLTMAHETAHWLDSLKGKEFSYRMASDKDGTIENKIAEKYKKLIKEENERQKDSTKLGRQKDSTKLGDYWYRTCECFARAIEQDFGLTIGLKERCHPPAYLPEEIFNKEIKPLIEELKKENEIKLNLIPGKFVTWTTKNTIKEELKEQEKENMSDVFDNKIENNEEYANELADWIIQESLECSVNKENYHISFEDIVEKTNTPIEWLNKNYKLVNEALAKHNDNELLEYNPEESNENEFNLNFCSNATENDKNTLFKQNKQGRWVRKTEEELEQELKNNTKEIENTESIFDIKVTEIFDDVSKEFYEKNKDFFASYEEIKLKQLENVSKFISDAHVRMVFTNSHSNMLIIRVEELKEMVKRCPSLEIALAVGRKYFNYLGNPEENLSHLNLYTQTNIGHYENGQMVYPTQEELKSFISKLYENSKKQETYIWNHYEDGSCCLKAPNGEQYFVYDSDADEVKITKDSNWIRIDELNLGDKTFTQYAEDYILEKNPTTYISFETNGKNIEKEQNVDESKQYSFFVKDTAEFEMFEEFETITGLTAKEAISEYKKLREDGLAAGIGINIPSDTTFNDPKGLGTTILVRENGIDTFDIYGDSFIVDLKENNERSQNRIAAYKELYEEAKAQGLNVKEPTFLFEKERELGLPNKHTILSGEKITEEAKPYSTLEQNVLTETCFFDGKEYFGRYVEIEHNNGEKETLLMYEDSLGDIVSTYFDGTKEIVSEEDKKLSSQAQSIDEDIYCYVPKDILTQSNEVVIKWCQENNIDIDLGIYELETNNEPSTGVIPEAKQDLNQEIPRVLNYFGSKYDLLYETVRTKEELIYFNNDVHEVADVLKLERYLVDLFDSQMKENEKFKTFVQNAAKERGDIFSSDRECAALLLAIKEIGPGLEKELELEIPELKKNKLAALLKQRSVFRQQLKELKDKEGSLSDANRLTTENAINGINSQIRQTLEKENNQNEFVLIENPSGKYFTIETSKKNGYKWKLFNEKFCLINEGVYYSKEDNHDENTLGIIDFTKEVLASVEINWSDCELSELKFHEFERLQETMSARNERLNNITVEEKVKIVESDNKTEELSLEDIKLINNFKKENNLNLLNNPSSVELVTDEIKSDEVAILFNYDIDKSKLNDLFVIDEHHNNLLSDKDNNVKLSFKVSSGSLNNIDIQCYKENKIYNLSFWSDVTDTARKELCNLLKEPFKSINNNIDFTQKGWNDEWHKIHLEQAELVNKKDNRNWILHEAPTGSLSKYISSDKVVDIDEFREFAASKLEGNAEDETYFKQMWILGAKFCKEKGWDLPDISLSELLDEPGEKYNKDLIKIFADNEEFEQISNNKYVMEESEFNVVDKILTESKMYNSFFVLQIDNNDMFQDFDEEKIVSLKTGLSWLSDGLVEPTTDELSVEELSILKELLCKQNLFDKVDYINGLLEERSSEHPVSFSLRDITDEQLTELKEHLSNNGYDVQWKEKVQSSTSNSSWNNFTIDLENYPYIITILEDRNLDFEYLVGLTSFGYDAAWLNFEDQKNTKFVTETEFKKINELNEKEFKDSHRPYIKINYTESWAKNHKPTSIEKGTVLGFVEGIKLIDELNKKFNTSLKSDISFYMWDEKQNDYVEYDPGFEFHDNIRTLDNGKEIPYTQTPITEEIRMICSYPEILDLFEENWIKQFAPTITDEQKNFIKELTDASYTKLNERYNQGKETLRFIYDKYNEVHSSSIIEADVADATEQSLEIQQQAIARLFDKTLELFVTKIDLYLDENKDLLNKKEFLEYAKHKIFNVLQDVQFQESRNAKYGKNGYDFDFAFWNVTNEKILAAGDYNTEFEKILAIKEKSLQQTEEYAKEISNTFNSQNNEVTLQNLSDIPLMPKVTIETKTQIIKENIELPFSIINNVEKGRVNIKFNQKISDKKFNSILKELKSAGWKFSSFNKQWYPDGKAVEKSETFAKELQEKFSISEEKMTFAANTIKETEVRIQNTPYGNVRFFGRNYKELDEFVTYFNRNLDKFSKNVEKIDESIAETIFESLKIERSSAINVRSLRLGLDSADNLVLLDKEKSNTQTIVISLPELLSLAKSNLEKEKDEIDFKLAKFEKAENKEHYIKVFGNLFQNAKDKNTNLLSKMNLIYETYISESKSNPKYEVLYPITKYGFKNKLKQIYEIDKHINNDILSVGKKLLSLATEDDKKEISEWLKNDMGCEDENSLKKLFTNWVSEKEVKQQKKKDGYPSRGE